MRWFGWFRRDDTETPDIQPIDVDAFVKVGLRDQSSAKAARAVLTRKRQELQQGLRVLNKQAERLTPVRVRNIARSGYGDIGPYQLGQHMQGINAHDHNNARGEQIATLERQLQAVDDGITRLKTRGKKTRQ